MKRARAQSRPPLVRKQTAIVKSLPAPVGGWNARDSLAAMPPEDAVTLENWFPGTTSVNVRYGSSNHITGITGENVHTLLVYNGPSSASMFCATDAGKIYAATTAGAVGAAQVSSLSNGKFQYINVSTTAGNYLMAVNSADKAVFYTGSAFARDGDGSPYNITGVDSATCSNINLHKNRVWLIEENSLSGWYLPVSAIGGAATEFSLDGVAMYGGSLKFMATWTIDAGYGVDDLAVFGTSEGEVIVYRGTDPSSDSTWALVGVWRIGAPIGDRPWIKSGGDLLIITQDGVQSMAGALQSSRVNTKGTISDKIRRAMAEAISLYGGNFGWELCHFEKENQLYLNVPVGASQQEQYVMNAITKNWCKFTGWYAWCFAIFNDNLYFGMAGKVMRAWNTQLDVSTAITANGLQSFSYLVASGQKLFTMMRPTMFSSGKPSIYGNVNTDYDTSDNSVTLQSSSPIGALWDTAVWDTDVWGPALSPLRAWQGASGTGYCAAARVKVQSATGVEVQWAATDIVYQRGGIL